MSTVPSAVCEPSLLESPPVAAPFQAAQSVDAAPRPRTRWSRRRATDTVAALDLSAMVAAGVLPAAILDLGAASLDMRHVVQAAIVSAILTLICISARRTYDPARIHDFPVGAKALLADVAIGVCPVSGLAVPSGLEGASWWLWHLVWIGAGFLLILTIHGTARIALTRLVASGRFDRRVAVFGAGILAKRLHDYMAGNAHGVRFAGLYDDRGIDRVDPLGLTISGKLSDLVAQAHRGGIDQIVIALPQLADRRIVDIAQKLEGVPASIHIVTHLASDIIEDERAVNVSRMGPVGLLDLKAARPEAVAA